MSSNLLLINRVLGKFAARCSSVVSDFSGLVKSCKDFDIGEFIRWLEQKNNEKIQAQKKKDKTKFNKGKLKKPKTSILKKLSEKSKSKIKVAKNAKVSKDKGFKSLKKSVTKVSAGSKNNKKVKIAKAVVSRLKNKNSVVNKKASDKKRVEKAIGKALGKKLYYDQKAKVLAKVAVK